MPSRYCDRAKQQPESRVEPDQSSLIAAITLEPTRQILASA